MIFNLGFGGKSFFVEIALDVTGMTCNQTAIVRIQ